MTVRSVSRFTELCACLGRLRARATSISTTKVINDSIMLRICTQKKKELAAKDGDTIKQVTCPAGPGFIRQMKAIVCSSKRRYRTLSR